jgi:hypothetical protein
MKSYRGSGGITLHFLNLDTGWNWVVTSRPGRFTRGELFRWQLNVWLGGPQGRSGRRGEEESLLPLPWFKLRTVHISWHAQRQTWLLIYLVLFEHEVGRDGSVGVATSYGLVGRGSNFGEGEIFRIRLHRLWGPASPLYNGYQISCPGVKRFGHGETPPPPHLVPMLKKE